MNLEMTLVLPPSVNSLYQNQGRFNPRTKRYELTGRRILTKEGEKIKKEMTRLAEGYVKENGWDIEELDDGFVYMDVRVYFNRRGRDADNLFKALQDSLQGVVYKNDSQVLPRTQKILFDKNNPRVEIEFSLVDYVGIFNNKEEAIIFEKKCGGCTRYLNGRCSILNDSLSGVVREEIGDDKSPLCTKYKEKKK